MSTDYDWEQWGKQDPYFGVLTKLHRIIGFSKPISDALCHLPQPQHPVTDEIGKAGDASMQLVAGVGISLHRKLFQRRQSRLSTPHISRKFCVFH